MSMELGHLVLRVELDADTRQFLRDLVAEFARGVSPAPARAGADGQRSTLPTPPGAGAAVPQPAAPAPTLSPTGDARPAGDEPASLDVSSLTSPAGRDVTNPAPAGAFSGARATEAEDALMIGMRRKGHSLYSIALVLRWPLQKVSSRLSWLKSQGREIPRFDTQGKMLPDYDGPRPDAAEVDRLIAAVRAEQDERKAAVPARADEIADWGQRNGVPKGLWSAKQFQMIQDRRRECGLPAFVLTPNIPRNELSRQMAARVTNEGV